MKNFKRIVVVVLDSVGIGQAPDSKDFGDFGVNTLGNISNTVGLTLPNLEKLGLGNIGYIKTVLPVKEPLASYGKMKEIGDGKDSVTGHWEMMGSVLYKGFKQFTKEGFPKELIEEFEKKTGRKVLANKEASGLKVIKEYFHEHIKTGGLIVYTSVDSTFQIAAHEDIVPVEELYKYCEIARELTMKEEYKVSRVIARPFVGEYENFTRSDKRHDYALDPYETTVMQKLVAKGLDSIAIGKISDLFNNTGVTEKLHNKSNMDGINHTINTLKRDDITGLIFTNLVDFDSQCGHPRDPEKYRDALEEFDNKLPEIIKELKEDDLLIITADHGNDPTYKGNDHTREYVPLLCYTKRNTQGKYITLRENFSDLGDTIAENFEVEKTLEGKSFLNMWEK